MQRLILALTFSAVSTVSFAFGTSINNPPMPFTSEAANRIASHDDAIANGLISAYNCGADKKCKAMKTGEAIDQAFRAEGYSMDKTVYILASGKSGLNMNELNHMGLLTLFQPLIQAYRDPMMEQSLIKNNYLSQSTMDYINSATKKR